jgi:hypothetical protein
MTDGLSSRSPVGSELGEGQDASTIRSVGSGTVVHSNATGSLGFAQAASGVGAPEDRFRCRASFSVNGSPLDDGLDRPLPQVERKVFMSKAFLRFSM